MNQAPRGPGERRKRPRRKGTKLAETGSWPHTVLDESESGGKPRARPRASKNQSGPKEARGEVKNIVADILMVKDVVAEDVVAKISS